MPVRHAVHAADHKGCALWRCRLVTRTSHILQTNSRNRMVCIPSCAAQSSASQLHSFYLQSPLCSRNGNAKTAMINTQRTQPMQTIAALPSYRLEPTGHGAGATVLREFHCISLGVRLREKFGRLTGGGRGRTRIQGNKIG